jgi:hypothetical protein
MLHMFKRVVLQTLVVDIWRTQVVSVSGAPVLSL